MRGATYTIAFGAMLLLAAPAGAESAGGLIVRVYNSAGMAGDSLDAARREAESILRDIGITVAFRQCGSLGSSEVVDRCNDPLKPSEVVVRVIDAPEFNLTVGSDVLGVANVVRKTNRGWLATLYADRITGAADRAELGVGALLGRVMAHEVGHLFLGTNYHGKAGVMRADWPESLLHQSDEQAWRFSPLELSALQRAISTDSR